MSRNSSSVDILIAQSKDIILRQDKHAFHLIHDQLMSTPEYDELMGGLFNVNNPCQKSLETNVQLALVYITAANIFADADYAKTALGTINYVIRNHNNPTGLYSENSNYDLHSIDGDTIKSILDDSQWLALKTYYNLSDREPIEWHRLYRAMPPSDLPKVSGLHRKQAPLALDGAMQILQQLVPSPHQGAECLLSNNIKLCICLWLSALYLNQPIHAEFATQLLETLITDESISTLSHWPLLLTLRLSYAWSDDDYQHLINIPEVIKTVPASILQSHINTQALCSWTPSRDKSSNLLASLTSYCETVVVIQGPAFAIRHWLQMTNNYFNPKLWVFAMPSESPTQASLYRNNGSVEVITDMDELVDLIGQTYHPSALAG